MNNNVVISKSRKIQLLENEVKRLQAENQILSRYDNENITNLIATYRQRDLERQLEFDELKEKYKSLINDLKKIKNNCVKDVMKVHKVLLNKRRK